MRAPCKRLLRRRTRGDGVRGAGMKGAAAPCSPRRHGLRVGAVIATAALTVLAAACSSSPSSAGAGSPPGGPGSSTSTSGVAYSACMRSHGVPSFPDPGTSGSLPKADAQQLGVSGSQLVAAQRVCRHLLPNTGGAIDAGSVEECMMAGDCPRAFVPDGAGRGAEVRRVHALTRGAELARSEHRFPGAPRVLDQYQRASASIRIRARCGQGQPLLAPDARAARLPAAVSPSSQPEAPAPAAPVGGRRRRAPGGSRPPRSRRPAAWWTAATAAAGRMPAGPRRRWRR